MSFLYPAFLAGAIGIAIPIVLHLLRRDVAPEVPFTAVHLLRRSPLEQTRRKRLRDFLLLVARGAALLLLAVAFARPYFASPAGASLRIVAVDRSFSMGAPGRFERAQALARDAIDAAADVQVVVIAFDDRAEVVAQRGRPEARAAVDGLRAGFGATRYSPLFARVREVAGSQPAQVVIVTDLQRGGWTERGATTIAPGIDVEVRDTGVVASNLAITGARRTAGAVVVTIANSGETPASAGVRVTAAGKQLGSAPFQVAPRAAAEVTVPCASSVSGVATAEIDDAAGYPADNRRFVLLDRAVRPRVLIVGNADRQSGFYLSRALQSIDDEESFAVDERRGPEVGGMSASDLAKYQAVVLLSTRGLDRKGRDLLAVQVRGGGGLLLAASDDVEAAVVKTMMGWEDFTAAVHTDGDAALAPTDLRHPVFRPFGALMANLGQSRFRQTWRVRGDGWETVARFTDGSPALLERREGSGRVLLFASDLDRRWNDFPLNPAFVPFAVETLRHIAASSGGARDLLVADLPKGMHLEPGPHQIDGRTVVVNVDPAESAPAAMPAAEFKTMLRPEDGPAGDVDVKGKGRREKGELAEGQQNLWRYGLLLMMAALVAESLVGRPA